MHWTNEKPTKAGWYWWRDSEGEQRKFKLVQGAFGMMLWYRENFGWIPVPDYGQWAGPIPEPEDE